MPGFAEYYRSRLNGSWQLGGSNCQACGEKHFPPRDVCPDPNCGHIQGELGKRLKGNLVVREAGVVNAEKII